MKGNSLVSTLERPDTQTKLVFETRVLLAGPPPRPDPCDLRTSKSTSVRQENSTYRLRRPCPFVHKDLVAQSLLRWTFRADDSVSSLYEYLTFRTLYQGFRSLDGTSRERIRLVRGFGMRLLDLYTKGPASSLTKVDL